MQTEYLKGRGAQMNTVNRFKRQELVFEHTEGLDEQLHEGKVATQIYTENSRSIINKVSSPDLGHMYSMNPYQGCEHGCIYCYARNSHEYWGFSAGTDFETRLIAKENAPQLLEKQLLHPSWTVNPIALSGNTDCYQPIEKTHRLTRQILEIFNRFKHPVGIITKNALIERDIDIIKELASDGLVHVFLSITTLNEELRRVMEPRTASSSKKLEVIEKLASNNIPVGVMVAPVIPGLNHHEIPEILRLSAEHGASTAGYTVIRLNGSIETLFRDWLIRNYPDRYNKVMKQIESMHGGSVNDNEFYRRMTGDGPVADSIKSLFKASKKRYFEGKGFPPYNLNLFRKGGNYRLF